MLAPVEVSNATGLYIGAVLLVIIWAWALSRLDASSAAPCLLLVSPAALLVAWLALGEIPAPVALIGGALTLAGVAVAQSQPPGSVTSRATRGRAAIATRSPACDTSS